MSKGVRAARLTLFLIAGASLTYYLLSRSGSVSRTVSAISSALGKVDSPWFYASLALFLLSQAVRAWRWRLLSEGRRIPMSRALPLTAVHVGLGHLLPIRLSDLALVGLFKRYASLSAGRGAAVVMLAKIMDLIAMGTVVSLSFMTGLSGAVIWIALAVAAMGITSLFFLPAILRIAGVPVKALFKGDRIHRAWDEMVDAAALGRGRGRPVTMAMTASFAGWTVKLFMFHTLLRAVGVQGIPLWQIFTAGAVTDLTMALPVHGLLSLGTVEAGWVAGFAITGITGELPGGLSIVEAGFTVHLLWLFMAVLLMSAGTVALLLFRKDPS